MKKKPQRSYSVPALDKGLDILEALSQAPRPLTIADLAVELRRKRTEIFRMLDNLQKRAYISRDPVSGTYSLTLKLYELAHNHSPVDQLLRAAYIPMQNLTEEIRESCHLSVLSHGGLVVIASTESPEPVRLSVEVGYRVLPLRTVSGILLLAAMHDADRALFLETDSIYAATKAADRKTLHQNLEFARKNRYYVASSTRRMGLDCSCLIGNPAVSVNAALGVPFMPGGINEGKEQKLIATIQETANRITAALGLSMPATSSSSRIVP
jgi:DNA-binding IclR family transcriptional regulator